MQKKSLPTNQKKITYRDFDLSFKRHPATGKLLIKKDDEAVKQAVKNLVMTNKYERPYHPEFGGDVRSKLFENFTSITASQIEISLNSAITNYERRVKLISEDGRESVTVYENPDENQLGITVRFRNVATLNDVSLEINLNRSN